MAQDSGWIAKRKAWARDIKSNVLALWFASRDARLPWSVRLLAMAVVGYALSPIDLIPDSIPILGYLDDVILLPLGIALLIRLIPPDLLEECRQRAQRELTNKPRNWFFAALFIALWIGAALLLWNALKHRF